MQFITYLVSIQNFKQFKANSISSTLNHFFSLLKCTDMLSHKQSRISLVISLMLTFLIVMI